MSARIMLEISCSQNNFAPAIKILRMVMDACVGSRILHMFSRIENGRSRRRCFLQHQEAESETGPLAALEGDCRVMRKTNQICLLTILLCLAPLAAKAQNPKIQGGGSFLVQCPQYTPFHPAAAPSVYPTPTTQSQDDSQNYVGS